MPRKRKCSLLLKEVMVVEKALGMVISLAVEGDFAYFPEENEKIRNS